jgi:hypothetical protein
MRRVSWDRHGDAWEGVKSTFSALGRGEERLGLPALGGLFAQEVLPNFENAKLENRRLLPAIWRLAWLRPEGQPLTRVNWRDMETEELGSVYESLLELPPRASADRRTFEFAEGEETRGNARKTSGSYYTPDALVKVLLDSTLEPVLDAAEARNPADPVAEILKLSIIDPASGSGHFLLSAARRAAARIARHRSPGAPSQEEFQHALREVVSHCIYGVDRNPMAVELCKVALWIEALEPGKPLTFLDSHIRCGDSLIGVFDYEMLRGGVPDEAYKPLTGDEKETAKAYAKQNRQQRAGKGATGFLADLKPPTALIDAARALIDMPEDTLDQIAAKRTAFERLHAGASWLNLKTACDCYVTAFFAPKTGGAPAATHGPSSPSMPLTDHVWAAARGQSIHGALVDIIDKVARAVGAFHWPIEFPEIFSRGGFDAVVGNPPWEVSQLNEQEYFAARSPDIAALWGDGRKKAIARLEGDNPRLWGEYVGDKRIYEATNEFFRSSGRFALTAVGKLNTYALFAEHFAKLGRSEGRSGVIVPSGIATDTSTSTFFSDLILHKRLFSILGFENESMIFPGVHHSTKFCILTIGNAQLGRSKFCFLIRRFEQIDDEERHFELDATQIARINPNTGTAPVFRSRADAQLTAKIHARVPVLIKERPIAQGGNVNPWEISFQTRLWNMAEDAAWFRTADTLEAEGWQREGVFCINPRGSSSNQERMLPLHESKMIHHFDHRWATFSGGSINDEEGARNTTIAEKSNPTFEVYPRYWFPESESKIRSARVPSILKRSFREADPSRCLKNLGHWLMGYFTAIEGRAIREADLITICGRSHAWRAVLGVPLDKFLLDPKGIFVGKEMQRETPLTTDDIAFLIDGPNDPLGLAAALIDRKQPRWLIGWRDITSAVVERTVIASVFPAFPMSHTASLLFTTHGAVYASALVALLSSLSLDFIARQKLGGTHMTVGYLEQLPIFRPMNFEAGEFSFITRRVLELTYTSCSMRLWAEDLGHSGPPFVWDEQRRAELRAELDAFFARKYSLSRDELRYVLDPLDAKGGGYPSETFRVLKTKEEARYGEYRTRRLVLEAFDRLNGAG